MGQSILATRVVSTAMGHAVAGLGCRVVLEWAAPKGMVLVMVRVAGDLACRVVLATVRKVADLACTAALVGTGLVAVCMVVQVVASIRRVAWAVDPMAAAVAAARVVAAVVVDGAAEARPT